tara:strand:- start:1004 stop:1483 length:480 start_codon:yes stop_codon:yes gene_type:complete
MALPQPGNPISANMINVEASRAGNTANTKLAGASTPAAGSLVKIYAVASPPVNQVAPHKFSEFYGRSFPTVTSYSSSVMGVFNQACPFNGSNPGLSQTYYHDGSGTLPSQGDVCYSNSAGTTVLLAGYYNINSSTGQGNRQYIKISSNGIVDLGYPAFC